MLMSMILVSILYKQQREKKKRKAIIIEAVDAKTETSEEEVAIVPANEPAIRNPIYTVRGTQIMLDRDLSMLNGVETKALNQAVPETRKGSRNGFASD